MKRSFLAIPSLILLSALGFGTPNAGACTIRLPPTMPEPKPDPDDLGVQPGGQTLCRIGIQVELFTTTATTGCACGISFVGGLPAGVQISSAQVLIKDTVTGATRIIPEFGFTLNNAASTALSGQFGGQWFGFSDDVAPVSQPVLGPNEIVQLAFLALVDPGFIPATFNIQMAAGEADLGTGLPQFGGPHPVQIVGGGAALIPEPSAALLGLLGIGTLFLRRRG